MPSGSVYMCVQPLVCLKVGAAEISISGSLAGVYYNIE